MNQKRPFIIEIVQDYFERMLEEVTGIKALILDEETASLGKFSSQK